MSKFKPTVDQSVVLQSKDKNLLVSASAGSGKTATLIEKIYSLINDDKISLKNILVITFTEMASSEMKLRLKNKLFEFASNSFIKEQIDNINSSYICTLHSLCANFIRKYFYVLDLNPNFKVLSEENAKYLKVKALEETFNFYNLNKDENFVKLSAIFGRDILNFKKAILDYNNFLCSILNKEQFTTKTYESCFENLNSNKSCDILNEYLLDNFYYYKKSFEEYLIKAEKLKAYYFVDFIKNTIEKLNLLNYKFDFWENRQIFSTIEFLKITQKRLTEEDGIFKEEFKDFYKEFVTKTKEMFDCFFCLEDKSTMLQKLICAKEFLEKFNEVEQKFEQNYNQIKQKRSLLDFNDLEKYMQQLLKDEGVLKELNNTFSYVFIDEYQDINDIQEDIICKLGKKANIVMVGDVKQSIYGFRNSTPDIFIEKSLKFSSTSKEGKLVLLNDNFRSNKSILNFVNGIFSKIMVAGFGGVDYKEKSLLSGQADYAENPNFPTIKLCLIDKSKEEDVVKQNYSGVYSVLEDENNYQQQLDEERKEAMIIAENIVKLVNKQKYYDIKDKQFKTICFNDIAVLSRSNEFLKNVCKVLEEYKIPISTNQVENIFLNQEVNVLICLLKLLSSTHDDISLSTCLVSLFGGLTYDDLAKIKLQFLDEEYFYLSVKKYLQEGQDQIIVEKLKLFFSLIEDLKTKIYSTHSIYDILLKLDNDFNYLTYLSSLPGGTERRQVVSNFIDSFKNADYNFDLEKYLSFVENFKQDNKFVSTLNDSENSVKVETIHASKGLEYPIVFVCGLGKNFSNKSFVSTVLKDGKLGLCVDSYDLNTFIKQDNLAKSAFLINLRKKEKAEELRLLYVALTRAKNNLVLIGHVNSSSIKRVENYKDAQNCNSYLPWVLSGLSTVGFGAIKNGQKSFVDKNKNFEICVEVRNDDDFIFDNDLNKNIDFLFNKNNIDKNLERSLNYNFNFVNNIALKNTVSSLLQEFAIEDQGSFNIEPKNLTIFENSFGGAEIGTAYHKIMQEIDFLSKDCVRKEYLQNVLNKLNFDKKILEKIDLEKIVKCVEKIKNLNPTFVLKEQQFLSYIPYCEIVNDSVVKDKVLIQGVVDLFVKTPSGNFVIDYKTNNVKSPDQLVEKYKTQLNIYKKCLKKAIDTNIDKALIYSFSLNKFIEID